MGNLTTHFDSVTDNFLCPCCKEHHMDEEFMDRLEAFRVLLGVPFSIIKGGGYRCPVYEGSKTSAHREGRAVDPDFSRKYYFRAVRIAQKLGFTGIGIKNKNGKFQLHLDDTETKGKRIRPAFWTY